MNSKFTPPTSYRSILMSEFEARQRRNPRYNLSSFARLLGFSNSRLSEILRGKVGISKSKASKISKALNFSESETRYFFDLVLFEDSRSSLEKEQAKKRLMNHQDFTPYPDDSFNVTADWYHHAISIALKIAPEKNAHQIAASLGLSEEIVRGAIQRLIKEGLLEKKGELLLPVNNNLSTTRDVPSEAIKRLNEQIMEKALVELRAQSIENRDYSIVFLPLNKDQLPLAKERIREFRRSFMHEFEGHIGKDSVYTMAVQLFELSGNEIVKP